MDRRGFVRICGAGLAALQMHRGWAATENTAIKSHARVKLVLPSGAPLGASQLLTQRPYMFHYPYAGTPCLLLRLDKAVKPATGLRTTEGQVYESAGGVSTDQAIVAFSAICPHQLSYLSKKQSFINYRADKSETAQRSNVIVCCAHHSVFDPTAGGRVLAGPAPQPLTTIVLEHDADSDTLYAIGTLGHELFREYFRAYKIDLIKAFGRGVAKQAVSDHTIVQAVSEYTAMSVLC